MADGAPVAYVAMTSLFGFIIPLIAIVILYIIIIRHAVKERVREHPRIVSQAYADSAVPPDSDFWTELNASKYVGVLVILWCVLRGPYLLLSFAEQFRKNDGSTQPIRQRYPWRVELALTWMYLSYPMFLPIVTFCWRKEVWQKFKNLILCRKSNLINNSEPVPVDGRRPPSRHLSEDILKTVGNKELMPGAIDLNKNDSIPVLFATEDGLHFQSYANRAMREEADSSPDEDEVKDLDSSNVSKRANARKCDVYGSQVSVKHADDDTSDYNSSEGDLFSRSNPFSSFCFRRPSSTSARTRPCRGTSS